MQLLVAHVWVVFELSSDVSTEHLPSRCTCRFGKPARKTPGKGGQRYWKNVGLGFKTPKEAMEGEQLELVLVAHPLWQAQRLRKLDGQS